MMISYYDRLIDMSIKKNDMPSSMVTLQIGF